MRISTKGLYALRMMVDLAEHYESGYIPLKEISGRQGISKKYLEQIIPIFNKSDVLLTNRGSKGGYRLARAPKDYTVGEIVRLAEGSLSPVDCLDNSASCDQSADCAILPLWQGLARVINEYLDGITLQDVVDQQRARYADNYVI